jgi:hypothetical protein
MSEFNLNETIKQAEAFRRQSERQMFNGKKDEAVTILLEAQAAFAGAKAAEPENPQVKGMESKLNKLQKDLERRIGRPIGAESEPAPSPAPAAASPPKVSTAAGPKQAAPPPAAPAQQAPAKPAASAQLPYHARQPMQKAQSQLRSMEGNFKSLETAHPDMVQSLLSRIENNIKQAKTMLQSAMEEAAKAGVNEHPDLTAVSTAIADAEKRWQEAAAKNAEQAAQAAAGAEVVNTDCDALKNESERLRETFDKCGLLHYNDLAPLNEQIQLIEAFEQNELDGLKEKLQAFENKYGSSRDEIDKNANAAGYSGNDRASMGWSILSEGIARIADTRTQMAEDIIKRVESMVNNLKNLHDFSRRENHGTTREWLEIAERYSSDHPNVQQMRQSIESRLQEDLDAFNGMRP